MMLGVLCQQKKPLPRVMWLFNNAFEGFKNYGSLGTDVIVTTTGWSGSYLGSVGGRFQNNGLIIDIHGDIGLNEIAQANQSFEFGCDMEIVTNTYYTFPLLSKTNTTNGGSRGWEFGFTEDLKPYYKDLATATIYAGLISAPIDTVFAYKVVSDGLTHKVFFDGVEVFSCSVSTANVVSSDHLYVNNNYAGHILGKYWIDNFYIK